MTDLERFIETRTEGGVEARVEGMDDHELRLDQMRIRRRLRSHVFAAVAWSLPMALALWVFTLWDFSLPGPARWTLYPLVAFPLRQAGLAYKENRELRALVRYSEERRRAQVLADNRARVASGREASLQASDESDPVSA